MSCFSALVHMLLALLNLAFLIIDITYVAKITTLIIYSISIILIFVISVILCYHVITFAYLARTPLINVSIVLRIAIIPLFFFTLTVGIASLMLATNMKILGNSQYFSAVGGFFIAQAVICAPEIIVALISECKKCEKNAIAPKKYDKKKLINS